jgi:peptide chain release factor 2
LKLRSIFDLDNKREKLEKLEKEISKPDLWNDKDRAKKLTGEVADIKDDIKSWEKLIHENEEIKVMNELAVEAEDKELIEEEEKKLMELEVELEGLEIRCLLGGKFDKSDAIVSINAGAGGTESCDWAEILLRMYLRWADNNKLKVQVFEILSNEEAGIKNVAFTVKGKFAYGYLRAEKGVHRLVRISPYDFSKRRHTSFASVDVIPLLDEEVEIEINPKDLRVETFRAGGPGGQYVNVTDSAVRITHIPSKIVVSCQNERSQFQNKETAMKVLKARLFERERIKREEELEKIRGEKRDIAWGSQIRSYILHPYNMIKDHRTGLEEPRVEKVLDGGIDQFINAFLKKQASS